MSIEDRTRTPDKDAMLARYAREFLDYLTRVRRTVELPYANGLAWRISDVQGQLKALLDEIEPEGDGD